MERLASLLGLFVLLGIAWVLSTDRRAIRWRPVIWGVGLQLGLGILIFTTGISEVLFEVVDAMVSRLLWFSGEGAHFVFQTVEPHQVMVDGEHTTFIGRISPPVKTFAFWILPTIVFFSSLMSVLYHLGIMQVVIRAIAWAMQRTMGTSGSESLACASNIFVGQTEAPLVVRPYVETMTKSELHALMTGGFATVAGGVMAAYVGFLGSIDGIAGHLVVASILSAPAALAVSKVMVPETEESPTMGVIHARFDKSSSNVMEAAANGATDGMKLALNVAAMLIAFVGLVAMADWGLGLFPDISGAPLSLSRVLGWLFFPIALAMGVPWEEAGIVGGLLGEKLVLTEFLAYIHLGDIMAAENPVLSQRSAIICSYGLCGFANFASIGIQLGGIGGIAPSRMGDLASLALRALAAGSLAAFMTGTIAGVLIP